VAIQQAREVFDLAADMGFNMTLLDIGGGYPGQEDAPVTFQEVKYKHLHYVITNV
jgi:ornithine decarboxylase